MGFLSFLLGRDVLGHSIAITYKGSDTHPTMVGSTISILIKIFVIVYLVQKSLDLAYMEDPSIQSYERPIYDDEQEEMGEVNFADKKFHLGVYFKLHSEGH